jgi:hypothetical protein
MASDSQASIGEGESSEAAGSLVLAKVIPSVVGSVLSDVASSSEDAATDATSSHKDRLQALWDIKETDVGLSPEIARSFEIWKADPSVFLCSTGRVPLSSTKAHYEYSKSMRASGHKVLWRFVATTYYDIISACSQSDRYSITKTAAKSLVGSICEASSYKQEDVEKDVTDWAKEGGMYRPLADLIGGLWSYFYYPGLSEWM